MYLKKFNKIIFELIEECLNYTTCKRLNSIFERREQLSKLSALTEKLDNDISLNKEEQEIFIELLDYLSDCVSRRGCNDYKMPNDFSKFELDKINREYHNFNGDPEEYDPSDDFSTTFDFIILYYIEKKYSIYFEHIEVANNLKKF